MAFYIDKIRDLMKHKKVTIESLADELGVSRNGLQKMFYKEDLKVSTLIAIAKCLKVDVCYFFGGSNLENSSVDNVFDTLKEMVKTKMK